ncbi:phosphotransferase [Nostocoides sp. F2B08]|uniref:phosphotransferase family protein n=1 Tax=Nostocoides sp. F2B08 TaxID=2653936 RepID=UPI0012634CF5|nr:aminoglycoside phosphotransferase family protein [Tetrasphaera sp. F2B08]KAB7745223.1 phosphotransferase [Tetrasphaera sp. F2B08]
MDGPETSRAAAAAASVAAAFGLAADDVVILNNSNKLTLRLLPCDVVARVAPVAYQLGRFEIPIAQRLASLGSPVAVLDPRIAPGVHSRGGFEATFWTYYEAASSNSVAPADYADALHRLHTGMRAVDVSTPHFTDRVESAQRLLVDRDQTPTLVDVDRALLIDTLRTRARAIVERGTSEQLLHGEAHSGNLLTTRQGLLFIDFETCCRGPVEFDLAHAPEKVSEFYPEVDRDVLRDCRLLTLALMTTWRWDRDDQLPNGRQLGLRWLSQLRAALQARDAGVTN